MAAHAETSLNRLAASATTHCLTGCAIGEVLGFIIGTALGWGDFQTIALAVVLAFFFGYLLTSLPLFRSGMPCARSPPSPWRRTRSRSRPWRSSTTPSCSSSRASWRRASATPVFWWSLALALAVAWVITFPVNRWMIGRGRGHAVVHEHHHH